MPLYKGKTYTRDINVKDADGVAVDISEWELIMHVKYDVYDADPLLELSTDNGGLVIVNGAGGIFRIIIYDVDGTEDWEEGWVVFDITRTDGGLGNRFFCSGRFKVRQPVTVNA